jgi:O-antigen/teichoic acid export membrane protein
LTLPIYSRVFEPAEYGVWNYLVTLTFLLQACLLLGGDAAYGRFFFAAGTQRERETVTWTAVVGIGGLSTILALALLPFSGEISDWSFGTAADRVLVALAVITAPVVVVSALLGQALRNEFRPLTFAVLNLAAVLLGVGVGLFLVLAHDLGVKGVLIGSLVGSLVVLPVRFWTVRTLLRPTFSSAVLRGLLRFGLPLVPAALALWIFAVSDRIVLGQLSTFRELGLYTAATSVASLITVLLGPLGQAWSPHALEAYERDSDQARLLYGRVATLLLAAFGLLAVVVSAFAPELVALLTVPEFDRAHEALAPLALGAVAFATVQVTAIAFSLKHRTGTIAVVTWGAAVFNLVLNLAFVPRFGMLASAWATAASSVVLTVTYVALGQRLWRVPYETGRLVAIGAATAVFALAAGPLEDLTALAVAVKTVYCGVFAALVVLLLGRRETAAARTVLRGVLPLRARGS